MIPLSDGIRARSFPFVNVAIIAANFIVWIFYELPHLNSSVFHASFYPCALAGNCHAPEPWEISWFTAMFLHASCERSTQCRIPPSTLEAWFRRPTPERPCSRR